MYVERGWAGRRAERTRVPAEHRARLRLRRRRRASTFPARLDGRVPDREWRRDFWEANKDFYCNFEEQASPEERDDPYLQQLYAELCVDGYQMRPGDAVLSAIGQGDVLATPLQMARAYAAIANGGTLYRPQVARAVMSPDGEVVKEFEPKKQGKVPASDATVQYIQDALASVPVSGSAAYRYTTSRWTQLPDRRQDRYRSGRRARRRRRGTPPTRRRTTPSTSC